MRGNALLTPFWERSGFWKKSPQSGSCTVLSVSPKSQTFPDHSDVESVCSGVRRQTDLNLRYVLLERVGFVSDWCAIKGYENWHSRTLKAKLTRWEIHSPTGWLHQIIMIRSNWSCFHYFYTSKLCNYCYPRTLLTCVSCKFGRLTEWAVDALGSPFVESHVLERQNSHQAECSIESEKHAHVPCAVVVPQWSRRFQHAPRNGIALVQHPNALAIRATRGVTGARVARRVLGVAVERDGVEGVQSVHCRVAPVKPYPEVRNFISRNHKPGRHIPDPNLTPQ